MDTPVQHDEIIGEAAHPDHQIPVFGRAIVGFPQGFGIYYIALELSAAAGYKAVRLDLIDHSLPAAPVYTKAGFRACGSVRLFYDAVGWRTFYLFEYALP